MGKVLGLVIHIMAGAPNGSRGPGPQGGIPVADGLDGCDSEFHNPSSQVSAHFGTGFNGRLYQWVDTADGAWAEVAGNDSWISIENTGYCVGGVADLLLPSQVASCAQVLAWLHETHGVPLQLTESPSTPGLGYHAMGGQSWGGHPCPCPPIIAQRSEILALAKAIVGGSPVPPPAHLTKEEPVVLIKVADPKNGPGLFANVDWVFSLGGKLGPVAAADLGTINSNPAVEHLDNITWATLKAFV